MDHPAADQTTNPVLGQIIAGQNGNDAFGLLGAGNIELFDIGMGMGGAQKSGMGLARTIDVVGILALARDESEIFLAAHRSANTGR